MQLLLDETGAIKAFCIIGGTIEGAIIVPDDIALPEDFMSRYFTYKYDGSSIVFNKDYIEPIEPVIGAKIAELSAACEKAIISGFAVDDKHYSFTVEDQANILAWAEQAKAGKSVPYHADGQLCRIYTAAEFLQLVGAATYYKVSQQTYYNCLKAQVLSLSTIQEVKAVVYGKTDLVGKYKAAYDTAIGLLQNEV